MLIVDVSGFHAGPDNACGCAVFRDDASGDICLSRERCYVDRLFCENREIVALARPSHADGEELPRDYVLYLDSQRPIVRRWDQHNDVSGNDLASSGGCLPLIENMWFPRWSEIEICLSGPEAGKARHYYRGRDYWLILARTAIAAMEWPTDTESDALPPRGVRHRYVPLGGTRDSRSLLHLARDFRWSR